jgi:hypothetical protein
MDTLIRLLQTVLDRIPWPSEQAHQAALDDLRKLSDHLGVTGAVPAPPSDAEAPPAPTEAVTPAPAPPDTQALIDAGWTPPASPEVAAADNALAAPVEATPGTASVPPDATP